MTNKIDHHGGAKSGIRGEQLLKNCIQGLGMKLLKNKSDFKNCKARWEDKVNLSSPYDNGSFKTDGYVPEIDSVVEIKYGTAHGTTEEKIFFDLEKIRDGVYDGLNLIYIFAGTPEKKMTNGRCWAKVFEDKVIKENLPVTVIFADLQKDGSMPNLVAELQRRLANLETAP